MAGSGEELLTPAGRAELIRLRRQVAKQCLDLGFLELWSDPDYVEFSIIGQSGRVLNLEATKCERFATRARDYASFEMTRMAKQLEVSTSCYYCWRDTQTREPLPNEQRRARVEVKILDAHPTGNEIYGTPRITLDLAEEVGRRQKTSSLHAWRTSASLASARAPLR